MATLTLGVGTSDGKSNTRGSKISEVDGLVSEIMSPSDPDFSFSHVFPLWLMQMSFNDYPRLDLSDLRSIGLDMRILAVLFE